jgi:hypothetical protein
LQLVDMVEESVAGARKLTGSHLAALNDPCLLRQKRERLPPLINCLMLPVWHANRRGGKGHFHD